MWRFTYNTRAGETETERNRKPKVEKVRNNTATPNSALYMPVYTCTHAHNNSLMHAYIHTDITMTDKS